MIFPRRLLHLVVTPWVLTPALVQNPPLMTIPRGGRAIAPGWTRRTFEALIALWLYLMTGTAVVVAAETPAVGTAAGSQAVRYLEVRMPVKNATGDSRVVVARCAFIGTQRGQTIWQLCTYGESVRGTLTINRRDDMGDDTSFQRKAYTSPGNNFNANEFQSGITKRLANDVSKSAKGLQQEEELTRLFEGSQLGAELSGRIVDFLTASSATLPTGTVQLSLLPFDPAKASRQDPIFGSLQDGVHRAIVPMIGSVESLTREKMNACINALVYPNKVSASSACAEGQSGLPDELEKGMKALGNLAMEAQVPSDDRVNILSLVEGIGEKYRAAIQGGGSGSTPRGCEELITTACVQEKEACKKSKVLGSQILDLFGLPIPVSYLFLLCVVAGFAVAVIFFIVALRGGLLTLGVAAASGEPKEKEKLDGFESTPIDQSLTVAILRSNNSAPLADENALGEICVRLDAVSAGGAQSIDIGDIASVTSWIKRWNSDRAALRRFDSVAPTLFESEHFALPPTSEGRLQCWIDHCCERALALEGLGGAAMLADVRRTMSRLVEPGTGNDLGFDVLAQWFKHYLFLGRICCGILQPHTPSEEGCPHDKPADSDRVRACAEEVRRRLDAFDRISHCAGAPGHDQAVAACEMLLGLIQGPNAVVGVPLDQEIGARAKWLCTTLAETATVLGNAVSVATGLDLASLARQALEYDAAKRRGFENICDVLRLTRDVNGAEAVSRVQDLQTEHDSVRQELERPASESAEKIYILLGHLRQGHGQIETARGLLASADLGHPDGTATAGTEGSQELIAQLSAVMTSLTAWRTHATEIKNAKARLAEDLQARDQQLREAKTFLDRLEQLIWVALGQLGIQEGRSPLDDSAVTALTELLDARLRNRDPWRDLIRSSLSCALAAWEDVASVVAERDDGAILNRALELDRVRDGLNGLCERLEAYYAVRVDGRAADERSLWYDVLKGALLDNFGGQVFQASDLLEKIFGDEPDLIRLKALLQSVGASLAALYALDADLKVQTARILDVLPKEVKDIDWTFGRSDRYWEIKRYRDLAPRLEKLKKATDVPEEGPVVAIKRIGWRRGDEGRPLAVILYSPGDWRDEQK